METPIRTRGTLRAAMIAAGALVATACQGPGGPSLYVYGGAPACKRAAARVPKSLEASLDPLVEAFDRHSNVPRMVVLMPHVGCERGAEILRTEVLEAYPDADLRLFVIWQDLFRNGNPAAAKRASRHLDDDRVHAFHDCAGLAGRAFACGNLPVAEARELFLFYPAGLTWPREALRPASMGVVTPQTESWVHQLDRVTPERFCTAEQLPLAIRLTMSRLLEEAERRRVRLARDRQASVERSVDSSRDRVYEPAPGNDLR
ncbi:MAG: hypothetical protein AAGI22_13970 [Planctomycetota bacterium]